MTLNWVLIILGYDSELGYDHLLVLPVNELLG